MENLKGTETEKNLYRTFSGESRARNKYTFYAEKAEREGNHWIAEVFRRTADDEKAHARRVFNDFLKLNTDLKLDLMDAIGGEVDEDNNVYKKFQEQAEQEGFSCIANFFRELRDIEEYHAKCFKSLLDRLEKGMYIDSQVQRWQCINCGYIHEGISAPEKCPACGYPQGYYKMMNYKCEE
ncbi:Rubrerythrin [Hathewaya proteolytica DSM 3090]|uniref:Rubrerythrin n=1 Tax=Hathewaya proteolytica DSM 3090 TaxID=1121331 RepID=A0A1M6NA30_9CLOT|nr:rubrerythrin family protein [Hathewaya proteolytica]SHJ92553.1 Rubrerythrin [Hathewaya proteolytica DSM 3090]